MKIDVKIIREAGYQEALFGLSLNKNQPVENMEKLTKRLCKFDYGHNKFLEHIEVWIEVNAPRYFWSQADTYRLASKNSQSTMHTITKRKLKQDDFEVNLPQSYLNYLNGFILDQDLLELKAYLPEGFMQRRMWKMSYKTLRNILLQRKNHKLPHWVKFCDEIMNQIQHPELLRLETK